MSLNKSVRRVHRVLALTFTAGVIIYMIAMVQGHPPQWVGLFALLPLILLLLTGLYLFALPYTAKWRSGTQG